MLPPDTPVGIKRSQARVFAETSEYLGNIVEVNQGVSEMNKEIQIAQVPMCLEECGGRNGEIAAHTESIVACEKILVGLEQRCFPNSFLEGIGSQGAHGKLKNICLI